MLARALVVASVLWPTILFAATVERSRTPDDFVSRAVYSAASHICHQRPDRSFTIAGTPWPVCGRCLGLYLAAPVGALLAWRRRRRSARVQPLFLLAIAALPTALTLAIEWSRLDPLSNVIRAAAALPLGAAIAAVLVRESDQMRTDDQIH